MKNLLVVLFCLVILAVFTVFNQEKNQTSGDFKNVPLIKKEKINPKEIPDGWTPYTDEKFKIAFAYPSSWNLVQSEQGITLRGGGYDISISQGNRGLRQTNWSHSSYVISNEETKTWEAQRAGGIAGIEQIISVREGKLVFHIYTPDNTKNISDRILSTVVMGDQ